MVTHLRITLDLHWTPGHEYVARVTTRVTDSCYEALSIERRLPPGMEGIPEILYLHAELAHADGKECAQVMHDIVQEIGDLRSEGHVAVVAIATVNGQIAGISSPQPFPRRLAVAATTLPVTIDLNASDDTPSEREHDRATCKDFNLLKIKGWPEFRTLTEQHCKDTLVGKVCWNVHPVEKRECESDFVVTVCHPTLEEILGDVESCLKQAVVAGVITGLLTETPPAAAAAATAYLKSCLASKGVQRASEVVASVRMDSACGGWHRV